MDALATTTLVSRHLRSEPGPAFIFISFFPSTNLFCPAAVGRRGSECMMPGVEGLAVRSGGITLWGSGAGTAHGR